MRCFEGLVRECRDFVLILGFNILTMNMKRVFLVVLLWTVTAVWCGRSVYAANPVEGMLERIDKGLSDKICVKVSGEDSDEDFFELSQQEGKPTVTANSYLSAAVGVNWYLKYYVGVHLSWNGMTAKMPVRMPAVTGVERHATKMDKRYYLNYCTHSYSMAFWDADRWQREIDWMALHGINMPLAVTGTEAVWRNVLLRLGYSRAEADAFVAGPSFQAWWLMNNLEGWGGPISDEVYDRNVALQKGILAQMREWGMKPVLAGYSGMVPHDASTRLGLPVADPGLWCGYIRPAFLSPDAKEFGEIAKVYYEELHKLYGEAEYYSMDPFHEGGNTQGVDLKAAGRAIMSAMKAGNKDAAWVVQCWGANPRREMIADLDRDDVVALDLHVESVPQWKWRKDDFGGHPWLYCMLLNFGGNVGLHGKAQYLIDQFYEAKAQSQYMEGVGLTMEGIENNPVMYELLCELPWRETAPNRDSWMAEYSRARYGAKVAAAEEAWKLLGATIYNAPESNRQQGTTESVFCSRPTDNPTNVSSWAYAEPYYDGGDVIRAARMLLEASTSLSGNDNYRYDLVDVTRQAVAEKARMVAAKFAGAQTREEYMMLSSKFMSLLMLQDELLSSRKEFMVGPWIESARACVSNPKEKDLFEYNARVQITTWGLRVAADNGGLHDYSHREWSGILKDFYGMRWRKWFEYRLSNWDNPDVEWLDFYAIEEPWTRETKKYPTEAQKDEIVMARKALSIISE